MRQWNSFNQKSSFGITSFKTSKDIDVFVLISYIAKLSGQVHNYHVSRFKTSLAVCVVKLKHLNLFISNGQALRLVTKWNSVYVGDRLEYDMTQIHSQVTIRSEMTREYKVIGLQCQKLQPPRLFRLNIKTPHFRHKGWEKGLISVWDVRSGNIHK